MALSLKTYHKTCKQKEDKSIRAYYDRFTLATLSVPCHEKVLITGTFTQELLPSPLSKKMQGIVPKTKDELKYQVEKYLRQIEGEERKEAKLRVVENKYFKHEEAGSCSSPNH